MVRDGRGRGQMSRGSRRSEVEGQGSTRELSPVPAGVRTCPSAPSPALTSLVGCKGGGCLA